MATKIVASKVYFVPNPVMIGWVTKHRNGPVGVHLRKGANKIKTAAQIQVGIRTGALKASINISQEKTPNGQMVKIGSPLSYALVHHEGSRPHLIVGRKGGMLRFTSKGRVVYTRAVIHPGTRPNKYLADNLPLMFT